MGSSDWPRMLSRPHIVKWAGFETTTARLQQAGWEISAEQDFIEFGIRLCMRHQQQDIVAMTDVVDFYRQAMMNHRHGGDVTTEVCRFTVVRMAHRMQIAFVDEAPKFRMIDAFPQMTTREVRDIEDLGIFATPLVRTQELIVDEAEVGAILAKLLEAQKPEQERIRERKRLRESREGLTFGSEPQMAFHAQILSIAA